MALWYNGPTRSTTLTRSQKRLDIEMYCQNPSCNKLIEPDEKVFVINWGVVHPSSDCVMSRKSEWQMTNQFPISYREAQKLAKEGSVKFGKLETNIVKD